MNKKRIKKEHSIDDLIKNYNDKTLYGEVSLNDEGLYVASIEEIEQEIRNKMGLNEDEDVSEATKRNKAIAGMKSTLLMKPISKNKIKYAEYIYTKKEDGYFDVINYQEQKHNGEIIEVENKSMKGRGDLVEIRRNNVRIAVLTSMDCLEKWVFLNDIVSTSSMRTYLNNGKTTRKSKSFPNGEGYSFYTEYAPLNLLGDYKNIAEYKRELLCQLGILKTPMSKDIKNLIDTLDDQALHRLYQKELVYINDLKVNNKGDILNFIEGHWIYENKRLNSQIKKAKSTSVKKKLFHYNVYKLIIDSNGKKSEELITTLYSREQLARWANINKIASSTNIYQCLEHYTPTTNTRSFPKGKGYVIQVDKNPNN